MKTFPLQLTLVFVLIVNLIACSNSENDPIDLCEHTTCQNGGECQNGICDCAEGYMGAYCETERQPMTVTINKIVVKQFPNPDEAPDIYIKLLRQEGDNFIDVYESDTYFEDATSPGSYLFTLETALNILHNDQPHIIAVFDYNWPNEDELIGYSAFYPYEIGESFPEIKTVSVGDVVADVYLSYNW